jgi:hypothetical protein
VRWELLRQVRDLEAGHVTKVLLYALATRAGKDDTCYPSIATIAHDSGLQERAVQRHLRVLEQNGLIKRDDRTGRASVFTLTLPSTDRGACGTPVHGTTGAGARHAPHPRTPDAQGVHAVHPKLKEKYPISATQATPRPSARTEPGTRVIDVDPSAAWRSSDEGVLSKARELGIEPRPGESYSGLTIRIYNALNTWQSSRRKA